MKKRKRGLLSLLLTAVMIISLLPCNMLGVKAAEGGIDYSSMTATNELGAGSVAASNSSKHLKEDGSFEGYIQTNNAGTTLDASDYIKVTYSVDGTVTADTEVLILQTFDTSWGGWNGITIKVGESAYDEAKGIYTAYVSTDAVLATLTTGKALKGINISYMTAEPAVTLLTYESLLLPEVEEESTETVESTENVESTETVESTESVESTEAVESTESVESTECVESTEEETESEVITEPVALSTAKTLYTITEEELDADGVAWRGASSVEVYVKMTEGGDYSALNAMVKLGPDGADGTPVGKASSKYLVGKNPLISKSGNAIQDNLVGNAGTGNYVFPKCNLNTTMQDGSAWDAAYAEYVTITVKAYTSMTNCEMLGLKFNNGAVYPKDFTVPVTEGTTFDVAVEEADTPQRDKLQYAVDFVAKMKQASYEEASWNSFMAVVDEAKALLANTSASEDACASMHAKLEQTKSKMRFVMNTTASNPLPFRSLTGDELVYEMGLGINLGNTLDGHSGFTPSETAWQSAITTKAYMKALHDAGYNTVRIPVTWGTMIESDGNGGYTINENWMRRVQEIVDYCVSQDMYAIINIHHDGAEQTGWLRVSSDTIDDVYYQYECVWRIIAEHFKDYDEHLIFESMNEITCMEGDNKNSAAAIEYDTPIIMNLNQIFVNTVRATGSNNTNRWLAAVAHYANNGSHSLYSLPEDTYNENTGLMFAAHIYKHSTNVSWTYDQIYDVVDGIKRMANKFNVPMYLGEWGNRIYEQSGTETGYNDVERAYFAEIVTRACQVADIVPCVWDQGFGNKGEKETGLYSYWNRTELRPIFDTIIEAMVRGTYIEATDKNKSYDFKDIVKNPEITEITSIALDKEEVIVKLGENVTVLASTEPANTNDVVLWSTDDDSVATVTRGIIRARGIGTTTIHAYSQSGTVEKTITVVVTTTDVAVPVETIITDKDSYEVVINKTTQMNVAVLPDAADTTMTYKSSNEEVVSVNAAGKLFGNAEGTAFVTIMASNGVTKTVKVEVTTGVKTDTVDLALHVLYNDKDLNYYGCETGTPVTVNGDGTYTVTFDLAKDLSAAGVNKGITNFQKLTAIYIKDIDVTKGEATKSPLDSAFIVYNSVKVNGTELTMKTHDAKSALNSGVFDSGKPINAWDGSVVEEVASNDHTITFTSIASPTAIEVTFTLSDVKFTQVQATDKTVATEIEAVDKKVNIPNVGETVELEVNVLPADADTTVTFVSANASVVLVDTTCVALDEDGSAKIMVRALANGATTVTAMTEEGLTVTFDVTVGDVETEEESSTEEPSTEEPSTEEPSTEESSTEEPSTEESNKEEASEPVASTNTSASSSSAPSSVVIEDEDTPLADAVVEGNTVRVLLSPDVALLRVEVMQKYYGVGMQANVYLNNQLGYTMKVDDVLSDIDLSASVDVIENFADGFHTVSIEYMKVAKLGMAIGVHANVGTEYVGKTAYIFAWNTLTGEYERRTVTTVNEIGNVGFFTEELTNVMILVEK